MQFITRISVKFICSEHGFKPRLQHANWTERSWTIRPGYSKRYWSHAQFSISVSATYFAVISCRHCNELGRLRSIHSARTELNSTPLNSSSRTPQPCSQSTSWRWRASPITCRVNGSTWCRSVQCISAEFGGCKHGFSSEHAYLGGTVHVRIREMQSSPQTTRRCDVNTRSATHVHNNFAGTIVYSSVHVTRTRLNSPL